MHPDRLGSRTEIGDRPERVGADEDPPLRPPQRDLLPEPPRGTGRKRERRLGQRRGHDVQRHAKLRTRVQPSRGRAGRAAGSRPPARRARGSAPPRLPRRRDRPARRDRRLRARARFACRRSLDPAEAERRARRRRSSPRRPHWAASCAYACSKTASGCAPSTSRRRSSRKAGTAFAPIDTASGSSPRPVAVAIAVEHSPRPRRPAARARRRGRAARPDRRGPAPRPVGVHQPIVRLLVPTELACELREPQRPHRVRDDVGVRVVREPARGE